MYICLCNALTERQVRQAAASCNDGSTLGVYRACGTQPRCGKCMPLVEGILRDVGGEPIHAPAWAARLSPAAAGRSRKRA